MRILLNLIIQLERLDKSIRVNKRPVASTQLRKEPRNLIQDRILLQELSFKRENTIPKSRVHVEALEDAVSIASSSQVGQTSGGRERGTTVGGEIRTKSLDELGSLLPETRLAGSVRRWNEGAEAVGVVAGVDAAALTEWLLVYHEEMV